MKKRVTLSIVIFIIVLGILIYMYISPYFTLMKFKKKIISIQNEEKNYKFEINNNGNTTILYKKDDVSLICNDNNPRYYYDGEKVYLVDFIKKSKTEIENSNIILINKLNIFASSSEKDNLKILNVIKEYPDLKITQEEYDSIKCYKIYMGETSQYKYIYINAESLEPVAGIREEMVNNIETTSTDYFKISYGTVTEEDVKLDF